MIDRFKVPDFKEINNIQFLKPDRESLSNGIALFSFNSSDQDLIRIEWIFNNILPKDDAGLSSLGLSGMLLEGTTKRNAAAIAQEIDFYGAYLRSEMSFDHTSLVLYSLNRHLPKILPIVKDVLLNSLFPKKELESFIRSSKQRLAVSLEKNNFLARRYFNEVLFNGTPYGLSPDLQDYDQLTQEALQKRFNIEMTPNNCTIIMAGNVTREVQKLVKDFFDDDWPALSECDFDPFIMNNASGTGMKVIKKENSIQAAIRMGFRCIHKSHTDFPAFQLLSTVLGGYFGSRLMMNIREDKGYTYGISSAIGVMKHSAFFTISTEVDVKSTQATLGEIHKEIERLRTEPIGNEELALVKNYVKGTLLGSLENIFSHADKFKSLYLSDVDAAYYERNQDFINQATPLDILEAANVHLDPINFTTIVVGD